ncbi:hypothetical protein ORI20_29705 [Mycobacterium sp. CVI_P3]|uniref:Uncharacterized protein n=1 Tax=Mycobacterium pinniadriaticum TaxID=2994102 RepID=A0ABT3SMW4_9MYCO|nr:hypothetical protein [Mycobacterium pinniadriaticum]MCX2934448.1 hypothetical protein [Mycobacterium pinniadriaticum]MCX2940871.1 hypothetical protein [Mycobacterium pinniadriaticum]
MAAGELLWAYAYEVAPRQSSAYAGGVVPLTVQLQAALDSRFDRSKIAEGPVVNFQVDNASPTRAHPVRDAALAISFADVARPEVVEVLADRLAEAMDHRSKPSLLMASVHACASPQDKRLMLWTFPQQEVFNLTVADGTTSLEVMDAFTTESNLRKVAMVEGQNMPTGMLTARVRDFQATNAERAAADLWIVGFLDARLQMSAAEGTRLLAHALRSAHTRTGDDPAAQDQINAAILGLRVAPPRRWSIDQVSATYHLGDTAASALVHGLGPEERTAMFALDNDTFDRLIRYTRFVLDNGVIVSAPFVEMDTPGGVELFEVNGKRRLRAEGEIQEEQVRSRG